MTPRTGPPPTRDRGPSRRARRVLPGGVTHDVRRAAPFPLAIARAEGARKWDLDGHEIICYVMGHGALLLGHGDPAVVDAVRHQATLAFHPGACHELECEWAEAGHGPGAVGRAGQVHRQRDRGHAAGAAAGPRGHRPGAGGEAGRSFPWLALPGFVPPIAPFRGPDTAGVPGVLGAGGHGGAAGRAGGGGGAGRGGCRGRHPGAVRGGVGPPPLPAGLLAAVREQTAATGTVLVFDEVVSGFRWSPGGVQAVAGVTPDLTALGKILAGGMPGGAVAGRADLLEHLARPRGRPAPRRPPGTHNAHPLSAAAGIATLRRCGTGEPQEHAAGLAAGLARG